MADSRLIPVVLTSSSRAEDAAFTALEDAAGIIAGSRPSDAALIGGQMVNICCRCAGVTNPPARATADADLGIQVAFLGGSDLPDSLRRAGYAQTSGGRFVRSTTSGEAAIDLLVPEYKGGKRSTRTTTVAGITTIRVRGLPEALRFARPLEITLRYQTGAQSTAIASVPDARGALLLKLHAWESRREQRDAFDVHRCLECCLHAQIRADDGWAEAHREIPMAREIAWQGFGESSSEGIVAIARYRGLDAPGSNRVATRVRALVASVLGSTEGSP